MAFALINAESRASRQWQRMANPIGLGLAVTAVGFSLSQLWRRPSLALVGIGLGTALAAAHWPKKERR